MSDNKGNLLEGHGPPFKLVQVATEIPFDPKLPALYEDLDDGTQYYWNVETQSWN